MANGVSEFTNKGASSFLAVSEVNKSLPKLEGRMTVERNTKIFFQKTCSKLSIFFWQEYLHIMKKQKIQNFVNCEENCKQFNEHNSVLVNNYNIQNTTFDYAIVLWFICTLKSLHCTIHIRYHVCKNRATLFNNNIRIIEHRK